MPYRCWHQELGGVHVYAWECLENKCLSTNIYTLKVFGLTLWPYFCHSINPRRSSVEARDMGLWRQYLLTEFRCGSCGDDHSCRRNNICMVLDGNGENCKFHKLNVFQKLHVPKAGIVSLQGTACGNQEDPTEYQKVYKNLSNLRQMHQKCIQM